MTEDWQAAGLIGDIVYPLAARTNPTLCVLVRFVLRSGAVNDTYFDKYQFEADPQLLRDIAMALSHLLPEGTEVLAGLEMGGIPIVTMLSQVTGIPAAFVRKEPKKYGWEGTEARGCKFFWSSIKQLRRA